MRALYATCRVRIAAGADRLTECLSSGRGAILVFWHDRTIVAGCFYRRLLPSGARATILASHSRDGALATLVAEKWGLDVLRGSASRGGAAGLRRLYRAVNGGATAMLVPDGPRGPAHRFKVGIAMLGSLSGRPIVPLGLASSRSWRLRSWDRMIVPKPFSRLVVTVAEPYTIGRDVRDEELERERLTLEQLLDRTTRDAETLLGVGGDAARAPAD